MTEIQLSNIPLFRTLPPAEFQYLTQTFNPVHLDAGEILFQEGDIGDTFYILTEGQVEVAKSLGTTDEQHLGYRDPGDFLGEMSLLIPEGLRTATVRAVTAVKFLSLGQVGFEKLLVDHPTLAIEMVRVLSLRLRDSDNVMIRDLTEKNRQLALAYQELKEAQAQLVEKEKLEHELDLARNIQQSILPVDLALMDGFEFGARMLPARAVGGDLYDFIQLDQDTIGISIGDVSDKGVHAAMFMALYCSFLRAEASHADQPADTLQRVNQHLLNLNEAGMFVTSVYGILNCKTGEFTYARAGHHLPILMDADGTEITISKSPGQLMGFFPDPTLDIQTAIIGPGKTLLLYTDGMFDVINEKDEIFGEARLRALVKDNGGISAQDLCDKLIAELQNYQGTSAQFDDRTVIAITAHQT